MSKRKKAPKDMIIDGREVMVNSANKPGRHDEGVRTGCGPHRSKKDYRRKEKHHKDYE